MSNKKEASTANIEETNRLELGVIHRLDPSQIFGFTNSLKAKNPEKIKIEDHAEFSNPRVDVTNEGTQSVIESVCNHGILSPIFAFYASDGELVVWDGRTRLMGAAKAWHLNGGERPSKKKANYTVPVIITDAEDVRSASLVANTIRQSLHPIEVGNEIKRRVEEGEKLKDVANDLRMRIDAATRYFNVASDTTLSKALLTGKLDLQTAAGIAEQHKGDAPAIEAAVQQVVSKVKNAEVAGAARGQTVRRDKAIKQAGQALGFRRQNITMAQPKELFRVLRSHYITALGIMVNQFIVLTDPERDPELPGAEDMLLYPPSWDEKEEKAGFYSEDEYNEFLTFWQAITAIQTLLPIGKLRIPDAYSDILKDEQKSDIHPLVSTLAVLHAVRSVTDAETREQTIPSPYAGDDRKIKLGKLEARVWSAIDKQWAVELGFEEGELALQQNEVKSKPEKKAEAPAPAKKGKKTSEPEEEEAEEVAEKPAKKGKGKKEEAPAAPAKKGKGKKAAPAEEEEPEAPVTEEEEEEDPED